MEAISGGVRSRDDDDDGSGSKRCHAAAHHRAAHQPHHRHHQGHRARHRVVHYRRLSLSVGVGSGVEPLQFGLDADRAIALADARAHQHLGVAGVVLPAFAGGVRDIDFVSRYGGEEFALIMIETDAKNAAEHIKRLGVLLAETPCVVESKNLTVDVTLSAGVASSIGDATSALDLVEVADKALYAAKAAGRNRTMMAS